MLLAFEEVIVPLPLKLLLSTIGPPPIGAIGIMGLLLGILEEELLLGGECL